MHTTSPSVVAASPPAALLTLAPLGAGLAACGSAVDPTAPGPRATPLLSTAERSTGGAEHVDAQLRDAAGAVLGTARFTQDATGRVHLSVHVRDVTPGLHGLHLHAVGACVGAGAFASAGGHYNPHARQHGHANPLGFHAGDLPNLTVNPAGVGRLNAALEQFTLAELRDADGTALVLHANEDDRLTNGGPQGPGNSGARIACGVLGGA
jgi:Cu-Zn family superoxide dismutase